MSIEQDRDLTERVRRLAAVADRVRLRVVDELSGGDLAPGELQRQLDVASNLLAHHVNTLEWAGVLTRSRSEGDRRRTYLRLVPGAFDGLLPGGVRPVTRVVFVCTANSARSQLAHALWRRASQVPAASAGTEPADRVAPGAGAAARRHGLDLTRAHPSSLAEVLREKDYVVTVCDRAHEAFPADARVGEVRHWSVPDPVRVGTAAAFDAAYDDLAGRVSRLAPYLIPA
jgi:protein-tyrosine-phosphatase